MESQLSLKKQRTERINFSRKFFVHGDVLMISSRTEEGLPFPPNDLINSLTLGILARAQELYPVEICHYVFLSNHFHLILRVINPDNVPKFVGYLKGEMAHMVNKLLSRKRKTVFNREYDSPKFLTPEDIKKYIKYLYLNPATSNLESSIKKYPGLTSWTAFNGGKRFIQTKKVSRREIKPLPTSSLSITESSKLSAHYTEKARGRSCVLQITPDAWAESFEYFDIGRMNQEIKEEIQREEEKLSEKRKAENRHVIGATSLKRMSMEKEHKSKKFGKRMTVICSDLRLRIEYLSFYKELCVEAQQIYRKWKKGFIKLTMPPGMFPPATPILAWAIPPDI